MARDESAGNAAIPQILIVEDVADDAELMTRELRRAGLAFTSERVRSEAELRDALGSRPCRSRVFSRLRRPVLSPRLSHAGPDLILLDLDLPKVGGREVLEQIKADERLRHIPVIVVTSSEAEEDIARSYRVNANAYVTKPIDPVLFLKAVNAIGQFWLEIVRLP